jgi:hypothetical protein
MGWVIEDFTKSELYQSGWTVMLDILKVPLQGSYSVPADSVLVFYCNVKVNPELLTLNSELNSFCEGNQNQTQCENQGACHPRLPLALFKKNNPHSCAKKSAYLAESHHITHLAHR